MKTFTTRLGLGTVIQTVIHAGVASAPLPQKTKRRIINCVACLRRARRLNRAVRNVNPFAKI